MQLVSAKVLFENVLHTFFLFSTMVSSKGCLLLLKVVFSDFEYTNIDRLVKGKQLFRGDIHFVNNNALRGGALYADKESTTISILDRLTSQKTTRVQLQTCPLGIVPWYVPGRGPYNETTQVSLSQTQ